jgi:hypothetical protein
MSAWREYACPKRHLSPVLKMMSRKPHTRTDAEVDTIYAALQRVSPPPELPFSLISARPPSRPPCRLTSATSPHCSSRSSALVKTSRRERRRRTDRERMGSPTVQTHQEPILLTPWVCL